MKKIMSRETGKKLLIRAGAGLATLGIILAGAAAFSAFEAHVVNVTATIENALTVPVEQNGLTFGNVFPEEISHQTLPITLSASFMSTDRVDDVEYMIRQKPKCGVPVTLDVASGTPLSYSSFPQVTENTDGTFICPEGSVELPLLCPYLSKHEEDANGADTTNGIDAFHGLPGPWTEATTENTQVLGVLSKQSGKTSTNWDIDLHTPCFKGECAQDWDSYVTTANPAVTDPEDYQVDPSQEHQEFGCDLWVEVTGISLPTTTPTSGSLIVTKVVDNSNGGGTDGISDFPLFVDGSSVTSGDATTTSLGTHTVTETTKDGYTGTFSGDCNPEGQVTVSTTTVADCILTNTSPVPSPTPTLTGTLTIVKNDSNSGDTSVGFTVTGPTASTPSVTLSAGTGTTGAMTVTAGTYSVSEIVPSGDDLTSAVCNDGSSSFTSPTVSNINIGSEANVTCTFTDAQATGTVTVIKQINDPGDLGTQTAGQFQMEIGGTDVAQNTPIVETIGSHTVSEANGMGDTVSYSENCPDGQVTAVAGQNVTCTVTNTVPYITVTVTKVVDNNTGGLATVPDFTLKVGSTVVTSGTSKNFTPGNYLISEQINTSGLGLYSAQFSGDCSASNHQLTGANGDTKQCTITNTDVEPNVELVANVTDGSASPSDFLMTIDNGAPVPSGEGEQVFSNTNHQIEQGAMAGYSSNPTITGTGCPSSLNTTFQLIPGQSIVCTINEATTTP